MYILSNEKLENIGKRIANEREAMQETQDGLAKLLGRSNRIPISRWENGKAAPPLEDLMKLCEIFECDIGYMMGEYEEKHRDTAEAVENTGLSEEAIDVLIEENKRVKAFQAIRPHERPRSQFLKLVSLIVADDENIISESMKLLNTKSKVKVLERDPDFDIMQKAYTRAMRIDVYGKSADGGSYEMAHRKKMFFDELCKLKAKKEQKDDEMIGEYMKLFGSYHEDCFDIMRERAELEQKEIAIALKFIKILEKLEY